MKTGATSDWEWATITPDKVIVANTERVWICSPFTKDKQFAEPMTRIANTVITRRLLDGAMVAAKMAIPFSCNPPTLSPNQLVWQLVSAYHLAHATPILMKEAAHRFAIALRHDLSNWALEQAKESADRDRLALLDIKSLGYRAEELVQAIIPSASTTLMEYFQRSVKDVDPIDCVGYIYATEYLSLRESKEHIHAINNLLPENINATRCLSMDSSLSNDSEKLEHNADLIARLSSPERTRVIRACYETSLLLFSLPRKGYLLEAELEEMLKPFKL